MTRMLHGPEGMPSGRDRSSANPVPPVEFALELEQVSGICPRPHVWADPSGPASPALRSSEALGSVSNPLRVALVADTLVGWIGGGVISGRRFVERLRKHHRVVVVGAALPQDDPDQVAMPGFRLPFRAMRDMQFTMARPDRERLREVFAEVDLVHLHFPFWLSYAALDEARALGRPVVASFHVQPENALLNVGIRSPMLSRAMYRLWVSRLYNKADAVVCPSSFAERKLRSYGLAVPAYVISNGTAPDLDPTDHGVRSRRRAREDRIIVLSVGRFAIEKRHDVLVEAVARCAHRDRIQLVLAGPGTLEPDVRRRAESLPNKPEIGFVERERLQELYESADVMVHSSDIELEGMAVVEAMALGLPVIVSDSSENAAADFAIDERFTFHSGDPRSLAEKLDALLDRPDLLCEAGARYAEIARTLDFGHSVERLEEIYRSLVAAPISHMETASLH